MKQHADKKEATHPAYISYAHIGKNQETGMFYGFTPLAHIHISPQDIADAKKISEGEIVVDSDDHTHGATTSLEEKIALVRLYEKEKMSGLPQPLMFSYKKPFGGDKRKTKNEEHIGFEIMGTNKSIAEALLIQTACMCLKDSGEEDIHVKINSIGDKDSLARFTRELTNFYKKHLNDLSSECRQLFKKDPFSLLGCTDATCQKLAEECPKSINFLSEASRQHFKEVLEYLEALDIPYEIQNNLVSNRDYCNDIIFEIRTSNPKDHPKAIGLRYDTLSKKLGHKKEIACAGVTIAISTQNPKTKKPRKSYEAKPATLDVLRKPNICFMQLGFEAKLKSLGVIEALRTERIPLTHSLAKDKMMGQVGIAEKSQAPIVLIMGKKEAMDNTVIVRETATRSQESVPLDEVANFLKKWSIS